MSRLDYEEFCALWFSRHETQVRQAETFRMGAATAALLAARQTPAWFRAIHDTADEAQLAYEEYLLATRKE